MAVQAFLMGQSGQAVRDRDGWHDTVHYLVTGVTGTGDARRYNAMIQPGVPSYGDAHPTIAGIQVVNITCAPAGEAEDAQFIVAVEYRVPEKDDLASNGVVGAVVERSMDFGTVTEVTTEDILGASLDVNYTGKYSGNFIAIERTLEAERDVPLVRARFSSIIAGGNVTTLGAQYNGKINSTTWNGYPAKTWLCVGPVASEINGSTNFLGEWDFVYRPDTWTWKGAITLGGVVPDDADTAGGTLTAEVYEAIDFGPLGFVLP